MYKITENVEKEEFIAKDGKSFDDAWDCATYEMDLDQEEKEKKCERMRYDVKVHINPEVKDFEQRYEVMWFKVNSHEELKELCDCYKWWTRTLEDMTEIEKLVTNYPDYVCIVKYIEDKYANWFVLSDLIGQINEAQKLVISEEGKN